MATKLSRTRTQTQVEKLNALLEIGKCLASERDLDKLLEMIAREVTHVTNADRSTIFVVDREKGELWSRIAQNLEITEIRMPIDRGIAGYVATSGEIVNVADAYKDPRFNTEVDQLTGYKTHSLLCAPMVTRENDIIGVIEVLNKHGGPFTAEDEEILLAFAGEAAVAVENALLYEQIELIMESFIGAAVYAIESRDPTTSGHSARVAAYTLSLAKAVNEITTGPLADVNFTPRELKALRYACLLHDFGKIGVREAVLLKSNKLYEHELELLLMRFRLIKRSIEADILKKKLEILQSGTGDADDALARLDEEIDREFRKIDDYLKFILECNKPTTTPRDNFAKLRHIAQQTYTDVDGAQKPYLTQYELESLSIEVGSLRQHERLEVESHVTQTVNFLKKIPWTKDLKDIALIAGRHHERLDGSGYPDQLDGRHIPYQTRMMMIADIYDSLTAMDRPYKKTFTPAKALEVLKEEARKNKIDGDLLKVFIEAEIYKKGLDQTPLPGTKP